MSVVDTMPCVGCLALQSGGYFPTDVAAAFGSCFVLNAMQHGVSYDVIVRCLCPTHKFILDKLAEVPFIPGEVLRQAPNPKASS